MEGATNVPSVARTRSDGRVLMRCANGARRLHHDGQKQDMVEWAAWNKALLRDADLCGTRDTASLAKRELDLVVFFWDSLVSHAHEADARVLLRLVRLHVTPIACNRLS